METKEIVKLKLRKSTIDRVFKILMDQVSVQLLSTPHQIVPTFHRIIGNVL